VLNPRAFVTDGSYAHALAIVRALGRAETEITVGERATIPRLRHVARWSRYCGRGFSYPDPDQTGGATVAALRELFSQQHYDVFMPVSLTMTELAVYHAHEFPVGAMLPSTDAFDIAADKKRTFEFAQGLGIPIPLTFNAAEYSRLDLPCVIKHRRSGALIAHRADDLSEILSTIGKKMDHYLAQEYIPGRNGYGYFGLFSEGHELGFYMHERLMQWPIEGGPSVVARSFYHDELREYGRCILAALNWTGVAMVEFKRSTRDSKFYLMEVNPKYWGSLDLAIRAGCNFPVWMKDFVLHKHLTIPHSYNMTTTFHWVMPNGLRCLARYPEYRGAFLRNILSPRVRSEIELSDPLPTIMPIMAQLGLGV